MDPLEAILFILKSAKSKFRRWQLTTEVSDNLRATGFSLGCTYVQQLMLQGAYLSMQKVDSGGAANYLCEGEEQIGYDFPISNVVPSTEERR